MRRILLAALALLMFLPVAQAQAPSSALAAEGLSQKYIATGETQVVPLTLILTVNNVVCTASVPLKVMVTSTATEAKNASAANSTDNRTFGATATPAELTFTIQQGAYGNNAGLPAGKPFQGRQTSTIAVVARNLTSSSAVNVAYKAQFAGYSGTDCRGSGTVGAATNEGTFKVDFSATAPGLPEPTQPLPLPSTLAVFALAVALLIMRRRAA
jgi:hypothetical protein